MGKNRFVRIAFWCCFLMLVLVLSVGCGEGTAPGESEQSGLSEQSSGQESASMSDTDGGGQESAGMPDSDGGGQESVGMPDTDSSGQGEEDGQYIGVEAARQIALEHAGLNDSDAGSVHTKLELEDGIWQYDVEFRQDNMEYDYDIDAMTGEILSFDHEAEYFHQAADSAANSEQITEEMARQIALDYAGVDEKDAQYMESELDRDDGREVYEVEWHVGQTEFSCDVDAVTGEVLSFEKDFN